MTISGWLQIALYFVVLTALVVPLGRYMARVFEGERTFLTPVFRPVEILLYRVAGVDETKEQHWLTYTIAALLFNAVGFVARLCDPAAAGGPAAQSGRPVGRSRRSDLQHRRQLRHQHQLAELRRREHDELPEPDARADDPELRVGGHRYRAGHRAHSRLRARFDARPSAISGSISPAARSTSCCRSAFIAALFLVWQGVPQNIGPYVDATTLEGTTQTLSQGPAASQIAIKQLGTNGGGFWNANSAVPYENPTPLSNFLQVIFILLIPAALTCTFGRMVRDERQGWALYAAMSVIFIAGAGRLLLGRRCRQSELRRARARPRQHGRQGSSLRHRQFEPVGGRDHRGVERLRQFHA